MPRKLAVEDSFPTAVTKAWNKQLTKRDSWFLFQLGSRAFLFLIGCLVALGLWCKTLWQSKTIYLRVGKKSRGRKTVHNLVRPSHAAAPTTKPHLIGFPRVYKWGTKPLTHGLSGDTPYSSWGPNTQLSLKIMFSKKKSWVIVKSHCLLSLDIISCGPKVSQCSSWF